VCVCATANSGKSLQLTKSSQQPCADCDAAAQLLQRARTRERKGERERKGHCRKQPLQGAWLRGESQSEGKVLQAEASTAAEASKSMKRGCGEGGVPQDESKKKAGELSSLPYFRHALF